jgi:hypothetical protein
VIQLKVRFLLGLAAILAALVATGAALASRSPEIPQRVTDSVKAPGLIAAIRAHRTAEKPLYVEPSDVEANFQEHGLVINHARRTVLDASCVGTGYHHGEFPYERYHIFSCLITTRAMSLAQFRVTTSQTATGTMVRYDHVPN